MGSVLTVCTGVDETRDKLEKSEKENEELRRQLLEAQDAYRKLKDKVKKSESKKKKAIHSYEQAKELIIKEKSEKKRLADRYNKQNKRLSVQEERATKLQLENAALKEQFATIQAVTEAEEEDEYSPSEISTAAIQPDYTDDNNAQDWVEFRNWLAYRNLNEKELKTEIAKLLTLRNESHRSKIPEAYKQRYGTDILDDISKIISKKGNCWELIHGLFMTRAQFDAHCMHEIITNRNKNVAAIEVAQIICCRSIQGLQLACYEYKKRYNVELRDKILKLSNGKTYQHIVKHIFAFKPQDHLTTNKMKIQAKIQGDVSFLMDKNVKWKNVDKKQQLTMMILDNNKEYVGKMARLFFKSAHMNLTDFIDNALGEKSKTCNWLKVRVEYCLDSADFYARQIQLHGDDGWHKGNNSTEINRIFIANFDTELKDIQKKFNSLNYGDSKTMIEWISRTLKNERYAFFLTNMLKNCHRL